MKHICSENDLILIEQRGTLAIYQCTICGKKSYELGSIAVPDNVSLSRCKIYVQWSNKDSLINQIHNLKKIIPRLKSMDNKELLNIARNNKKLDLDEMYLNEANELINIAKMYNLNLILKKI